MPHQITDNLHVVLHRVAEFEHRDGSTAILYAGQQDPVLYSDPTRVIFARMAWCSRRHLCLVTENLYVNPGLVDGFEHDPVGKVTGIRYAGREGLVWRADSDRGLFADLTLVSDTQAWFNAEMRSDLGSFPPRMGM